MESSRSSVWRLPPNCFGGFQKPREEWVLSWPGQVVIAGCQVYWTAEVSEALEQGDLADRLFPQLQKQVRNRLGRKKPNANFDIF